MTIADQARFIRDALNPWAQQEGGKTFVASDLAHLWQMAQANSKSPRAILCYNGEDIRGDFTVAAILGRVDRHWLLAVTRGRGFAAERGDALTETVGNNKPLYDLVDEARNLIRAMTLDPNVTERPVDFKAIRPMVFGDAIMDGYQIEFSIGTSLDQIAEVPASPPVPISP